MDSTLSFIPNVSNGEMKDTDVLLEAAFSNSTQSSTNHFQVLFREHLQNSSDAFKENNSNSNKKLIFHINRKKIDFDFADLEGLERIYKNYCDFRESRVLDKNSLKFQKSYLYISNAYNILKNRKSDSFWSISIEDNAGGLQGHSRLTHGGEKLGSSVIVNEGDSNKKDDSINKSKGTYGMGKITAFTSFNDSSFVIYVNQHNGKSLLLGKARFNAFRNSENGRQEGDGAFLGRVEEDNSLNGIMRSDWAEIPKELYSSLRSLDEDGLTTIIPILDISKSLNINWCDIAAFSVLLSFFKLFEKDEIEVRINDDYAGENLNITKDNYVEVFEALGDSSLLKDQNNYWDKYNYLMIKPFVFEGRNNKEIHKAEIELNVNKAYAGKAILKIFENRELDEYITGIEEYEGEMEFDKDFKNSLRRPFRILRSDMLLRKFPILRRGNLEGPYSGYFIFEKSKNDRDELNFLISQGEDPSHDDIDFKKYDTIHETHPDFPNQADVYTGLFLKLVNMLKGELKALFEKDFPVNEEFDFEIDSFENDFTVVGDESFERRSRYQNYILNQTKIYNTNNQKGNDASSEKKKASSQNTIVIPMPKPPKPIILTPPKPPKPPKPNPPKPKSGYGEEEEDPINELLKKVTFLSKKIGEGKSGERRYAIKFENIDSNIIEPVDLFLTQDSLNSKSILSFELIEANMDGKRIRNIEPIKHKKTDKTLGAYLLKNVKLKNASILQIVINEPKGTTTHFLVSINKSANEPSKIRSFFGN